MADLYFTPEEDIENFVRPAEREATPSTALETFGATFSKALTNNSLTNLGDLAFKDDGQTSFHDIFFKELKRLPELATNPLGALVNSASDVFSTKATDEAREEREQRQSKIDDILSRSPDGLLSGLNKLSGSLLGSLSDPLTLAAGVAAPELVGVRAASAISGMAARRVSPKLASLAGRLVGGAAEGAAITLPAEGVESLAENMYEDDFNSLNTVLNIGMGAALGSLAGFFHLKNASIKGISTEGAQQATQDAVSQMITGNSVDVSVAMKRGFKEARLHDNLTIDQVRAERAALIKEMEEHSAEKQSVQRDVAAIPDESLKAERLSIPEVHERIARLQSKRPEMLLRVEKAMLKQFGKSEEFKVIEKELAKPAEAINTDVIPQGEKAFKAERESIVKRVDQDQESVNNLKQSIKEETAESKPEIEKKIEDAEKKLVKDKERLDVIDSIEKDTPIEDSLRKLDKVEDKESELLNRLDELNTIEEILTHEEKGLTGAEVKKFGEGTLDGSKSSALDITDDSLTVQAEEVENEGLELRDDQEKAVDDFLKEGDVPEVIKDEIEAVNDEIKALPKYNQILKSMAECIIKNVV